MSLNKFYEKVTFEKNQQTTKKSMKKYPACKELQVEDRWHVICYNGNSCIFRGAKGGGGFGMFSMFKNLVGSKMLTREDLIPVLDKMREHLVGKMAHFGSND